MLPGMPSGPVQNDWICPSCGHHQSAQLQASQRNQCRACKAYSTQGREQWYAVLNTDGEVESLISFAPHNRRLVESAFITETIVAVEEVADAVARYTEREARHGD